MNTPGKWLTKQEEIKTADSLSLLRSILTPDGMGPKFKEMVLAEILKRKSDNKLDFLTEA